MTYGQINIEGGNIASLGEGLQIKIDTSGHTYRLSKTVLVAYGKSEIFPGKVVMMPSECEGCDCYYDGGISGNEEVRDMAEEAFRRMAHRYEAIMSTPVEERNGEDERDFGKLMNCLDLVVE